MAEGRRPLRQRVGSYLDTLTNSCGMDKLLAVYQSAYDRYKANA